ncbi:MAG TPA: response regulator transcription factor [Cyclobacteriaceae bacterium]|nr:response regulator transcription factor [Cyclobacteriaceae bacterium]
MNSPIRIAIAEDNSFALQVILQKLTSMEGIQLAATAVHGAELLEKIPQSGRIDIVLMDIEMPRLNGIETTRLLKEKFPNIKVLMLTIFDDDENIFNAIRAGADGYVLKEESASGIYVHMQETLNGGAGMSPGIASRVLRLLQRGPAAPTATAEYDLTPREIEILEQLKAGLSYDKIASNLFISYGTVRKHIENTYRKLQVHNKVEAVQKAVRDNIVKP